ncbi:KICSTOR complex protein ITFG2-like [Clavelina lepadiformis]|uniref:KICSTOR complex protein ITFG2-like n=1 Tax=Clavelina lepadiformis TaxID=159417 RepID=UPI004042D9E5
MRSVSFVNHLKLSTGGKVSQQCMALGDVDGDGQNELVVAVEGGDLKVYKGNSIEPWWKFNEAGDISCVEIGDVCNVGKDSVIAFTRNGPCSIIDLSISATDDGVSYTLKQDRLPANIINVLIGDVDKDEKKELIACHSDQSVSAYRWHEKEKKFILLQRWRLRNLAGNVTLHNASEKGRPTIMVSQPGCSYAILSVDWDAADNATSRLSHCTENIQYTPLSSRSRLQNPSVLCKILGDIRKSGEKMAGYFALCTLDGTLKLMEKDKMLWSLQVDHQLFALNKVDVLGDNREEVIVCAWDGQTYIVDHDRNVVRYQFQDNVQAFCAGKYSADGKTNLPCLVYADFHNKITLFYDVRLSFLKATDFLTVANGDAEMREVFTELGINEQEEKRSYLKNCLLTKVPTSSNDCLKS